MDSECQRRYSRHIMLDEIGEQGQQKIANASVLVIGAGGLGSAALSYLAAAGIGKLGIIDADYVESSNLQRQIIHEEGDIGRLKVESARDRISELSPACHVGYYAESLNANNSTKVIAPYDIVIDGCDNFATRFVVQAACFALQKPLVSGAAQGFSGQFSTFTPHLGAPHPCYRCFVPELPPEANNCTETGVIGPLCGIIGSMQALEALKAITGAGDSLSGRLLHYDALRSTWRKSKLLKNPDCELCSN